MMLMVNNKYTSVPKKKTINNNNFVEINNIGMIPLTQWAKYNRILLVDASKAVLLLPTDC